MRSIVFKNSPYVFETSSVSGPKEGNGELGKYIDIKSKDDMFNEKSFEKAEINLMYLAIDKLIKKSKIQINEVNTIIAGDLLNQIIASTYSARNFNTGFLGVYNACSSFTESIIFACNLLNNDCFNNIICTTSSHFSTAERQYRYPLELGSTRPPLSQWTVTGCGAIMLSNKVSNVKVTSCTIGKIVDYGIKDVNNMGAAMAPACADTIFTHLKELNLNENYYDLILTGDLGCLGSRIVKDLLYEKGVNVFDNHVDCGELIYNIDEKEFQGGSGAGCSSLVFSSYIYNKLKNNELRKVLLVATGALLSPTSMLQGESIPSIAHAVAFES